LRVKILSGKRLIKKTRDAGGAYRKDDGGEQGNGLSSETFSRRTEPIEGGAGTVNGSSGGSYSIKKEVLGKSARGTGLREPCCVERRDQAGKVKKGKKV